MSSGRPCVVADDASGVVEVPDTSGKFKVGDEVFVRLFGPPRSEEPRVKYYRGSCAEYCVSPVSYVENVPVYSLSLPLLSSVSGPFVCPEQASITIIALPSLVLVLFRREVRAVTAVHGRRLYMG